MPIYTYECNDCNKQGEAIRNIDDRDAMPECRSCGGKTTRLIDFSGGVYAPTSGKGLDV